MIIQYPFATAIFCAPRLLGNPRFSDSFLHGKLPFPDPFPWREHFAHAVRLCSRQDSNLERQFRRLL